MEETQTIESSEIESSSEPIESTEEVVAQEPIVTPKLREAKVDVDGHVLQINEKQLKALWAEFEANHNATSKVSDTRARKALGEIKKLVTPYRNASVEEAKK